MGDLDAIGRLIKFCNEWDKMRMKGDDIHGLHMGDEREAVLCASDIRQAADEIARLREERRGLVEALRSLSGAAYEYAGHYLLDERDDPELCDMFPNMHGRIVKLFNEIEAARAMIAAIGEPQP